MTQRQRKQSSPMALVLSATDLQTALEQDFPDGRWLRALELAEPTGVVTTQQLQRATDLSRDQMNRLLARLEELAPEGLLVRVQERRYCAPAAILMHTLVVSPMPHPSPTLSPRWMCVSQRSRQGYP